MSQSQSGSKVDGFSSSAMTSAQIPSQNAVYFVDSAVAGDALSLELGEGSRVFVLENNSDAFLQMEAALASLEGPVDAVHVYSHGAAGALVLGGKRYDEAALEESADKLQAIGRYLKDGADILLYACNTGAGSLGESFLQRFARLTGADVAASDNITGPSGDWVLEKHVGAVETASQKPDNFNADLDAAASAPSWGNIFGTEGNDTLRGFVSNDRLYGHGGSDALAGGDGNDVYIINGDNTAGTLVLEEKDGGTDTVYSRVEDFDLSAGNSTDTVTGVAATANSSEVEYVVLQAQDGMDAQNAAGNDSGQTIVGNALSNNLTGRGGNDRLDGDDGDDYLDGGSGVKSPEALQDGTDYDNNDEMDTLAGGKGNDSYIVRNRGDVVVEKANEGTDHVHSFIDYALGDHVENLTLLDGATATGAAQAHIGEGNALNNELRGNSAANRLFGYEGNDTLYGGRNGEADTLDGGAGNDAYYVYGTHDEIIDSAGNDSIFSTENYDLANAASVENLYLSGNAVSAAGNALNNHIRGNLNKASTLQGGSGGANTLEGGSYNDHYILTGDERSLTSRDVIIDSGGLNSVASDYTVDLSRFTQARIQRVELTGGHDVHATAHRDVATSLTGNSGSNRLTGGNHSDTVDGGAEGRDTLIGGAGDDLYIVRNGETAVTEAANGGNDTVHAHVDYTLAANVENVVLQGAARSAMGNNLANRIDAGDVSGNVVLHGGVNSANSAGDTLVGGTGSGRSEIYTYNANDVIELRSTGATNVIYVCYDMPAVPTDNAGWAQALGVDASKIGQVIYLGNPTRTSGAGVNITGSTLVANLMGTVRNDTLTAGAGVPSTLNGGVGADLMNGSTGADLFHVDNAGDSVHGGSNSAGHDTVLAGVNIDLEKKAADGASQFSGDIGTVELQGSTALNADGWADRATTLIGNAGANALTGGSAADSLDGGAGADVMTGGDGDDVYMVDNAGDRVVEYDGTAGGRDSIYSDGVHINLGSANHGSGNVEFVRNIADDKSVSMTGAVTTVTANRVTTTVARDETFEAGGHGDTIDGKGGADTIIGGAGNDLIHYYGKDVYAADVTNAIDGGDGRDTLYVHANVTAVDGSDPVRNFETAQLDTAVALGREATNLDASGSSHGMTFLGNAGNSSMKGSDHADSIYGGGGADTIDAGAGDDFVEVENRTGAPVGAANGGLAVDGGVGSDTLSFGSGNDSIAFSAPVLDDSGNIVTRVTNWLGRGVETSFLNFEAFSGGAGNDTLDASALTTGVTLAGGAGNDNLIGTAGNDVIIADGGTDNITTGAGHDAVRLTKGAVGGTVTVTDFNAALDSINDTELRGWTRAVTQSGNDTRIVWTNPDDARQQITAVLRNTASADVRFGQSRIVETGDFSAADVDADVPWEITATGTGQTIIGGNQGDVLKSVIGGNRLEGANGADTLAGVSNDTLIGGDGSDNIRVSGTTTAISVEGGAGDDEISVEKLGGAGSITGGDGKDTLFIHGVDGTGSGTLSVYLGGEHHDEVRLMGGKAELAFDGYGHLSSLGMDDATAAVDISGVGVYVGTTGNDLVDATAANTGVHYVTNGGNDTFRGGSGADDIVVSSFRAADTVSLEGGDDTDSVELRNTEALHVSVHTSGADGYAFSVNGSQTSISGFEQLTLAGENTNDTVQIANLNSSYLQVKTGAGNDDVHLGDVSSIYYSHVTLDGGAGLDTMSIGSEQDKTLKLTFRHDTLYGQGDTDTVLAADVAYRYIDVAPDADYSPVDGVALGNFEVYRGSQWGTFFDASALTSVDANGLSLEGRAGAKNRFALGRITEGSVSMKSSGGESSDFLVEQGLAGGSLYMDGGSNVRDVFYLGNVADGASVFIEEDSAGRGDELHFMSAAGQNGVNLALNANGSVRSARFGNGTKTNGLQGGRGISLFEGGDGNDTIDASAVTGDLTLSGGMGSNQIKTANAAAASTRVEIAGRDSVALGGGTDTLVLSVEAALRGGEVYVSGFNTARDHIDESALINDGWSRSSAVIADGKTSYTYRKTVNGTSHAYVLSFAGSDKPIKDLMTVLADDPSADPEQGRGGNLTTGAAFSGYLYGSIAGDTLNAAAASGPVTIYGNGGSDDISGSRGNDSIVVQGHNPEDGAAHPDTVRVRAMREQGTRTYSDDDDTAPTAHWQYGVVDDGHDTITVTYSITDGDYLLEGGLGNDSITVGDISGGKVVLAGRAVETGDYGDYDDGKPLDSAQKGKTDDDIITVGDITDGKVKVKAGGGTNVVQLGNLGDAAYGATSPDVKVDTGDGNDSITIGRVYSGTLDVNTDQGNDTVRVRGISGGAVTLQGQYFDANSGKYHFSVGSVSGGSLLLESESGSDTFSVGAMDGTASVTVQAGAGNDSISLAGGAGTVQVLGLQGQGTRKGEYGTWMLADGNDTITVGDITGGDYSIEGGTGSDSIALADISGGTVRVWGRADMKAADNTGADDDTITAGDVSGGSLTMDGNGGTNTLSVGVISGTGNVYLEGGHSGNTFYVEAVRDGGSLDVGAEGNSTITVGDIAGGRVTLTARTYDDEDSGSTNTISVGQVSHGAQVELYGTRDNTNTFNIADIDANATVRVNGNGYIDWQGQPASPDVDNPKMQTLNFTGVKDTRNVLHGVSVTAGSLVLENIGNVQGTSAGDYIDASTRITPPYASYEEYAQPFMAVHGNDGNDTLVGRSGQILTGGNGDDLLMPTETGDSWARGGNGNDTLSLERLGGADGRNMSLVSNAPYYDSGTHSITNYKAPGLRLGNDRVISMDQVEYIRLADDQAGGDENHLTLAGKVTGTTLLFGSAKDSLHLGDNAGGSSVTIRGFDMASDSLDAGDWDMTRKYPDTRVNGTQYTYRRGNDTVSVLLEGVYDFSETYARNASTGAGQTHTLNTASWYKGSLYGDTITVNLNGDQPFYVDANGAVHHKNRDYVSLTATGNTSAEHVISTHVTDTTDHVSSHSRLYVTGSNVGMTFSELDLSSDADAEQVEGAVYDSSTGRYKVAGISAITTSGHTADNLKAYGFGKYFGTSGADYADARGITNTALTLEYESNGGADTYLGGAGRDYVHADSLKATDRVSMDGGSSDGDPYGVEDQLILEHTGGNKTTAVNITFAADGSVGGESGGTMKIGGQNANAVFTNFECYEIVNDANNVINSSRVTKENLHIYIDGEGNDTMTAAVNQAIASGAGNDLINIAGAEGWNWINPGEGTDIVELFGAADQSLFTSNGDGTYASILDFTYGTDEWGDGRLSFNIGTQDNGSLYLEFNTRYLNGDTLKIYRTALNNRSSLMASIDLGSVSTALENGSDGSAGMLTFTRDSSGKYKA